ncbi:MAG: cytochrome c family protein [Candidatus Pelagibacter sp.]|nr:cytochrome c family protein [Candidatus Pelagibacter sp.]|tara:strand:- start:18895 stop:19413 length:519 start_codon:yes stop_codon:yes gene_type:complete
MVYELQKLITSIVLVVLVVLGISKLSNIIFKTEQNVVAYKVDVQEKEVKSDTELQIDLPLFLAKGTVEHGKKVFKKCAACHSINENGKNKIGPALWSVMNRKSGELQDFKYSKALLDYGKQWDFLELNGFLLKPATWIRGNKMGFAGLKDEKDRASVILYLNESSNNPLPLP